MEEIMRIIDQIKKEKGISTDVVVKAVEESLKVAYKKDNFHPENLKVLVDMVSGKVVGFLKKKVVEKVENDDLEIELFLAKKLGFKGEIEEMFDEPIKLIELGRGATQVAKQVMLQKIKEIEEDMIYNTYKEKEGQLINGMVQRMEGRNIIVELGEVEGILPPREQVELEKYNFKEKYKFYILEVRKTSRGPQVILSRTHPNLVKRLFEMEVPEILEGILEIKFIARMPGVRTKIAVLSKDEKIDPVGTCVGGRGVRIREVIDEIRGEKIDVIRYSDDVVSFITSSLSPAKIKEVKILEKDKKALVIVPEDQLAIVIGKGGQNVRLSSKLTGWEIDILTESQYEKLGQEENKQEENKDD